MEGLLNGLSSQEERRDDVGVHYNRCRMATRSHDPRHGRVLGSAILDRASAAAIGSVDRVSAR